MSWNRLERSVEKGPLSIGVYFIVLFFILGLVGGCLTFISNPFRQAARVVEKTIDADNMIYNYEWFKQRYQDINAIDAKIIQSQRALENFKKDAGERSNWHRDDREEYNRLSAVELGLNQQRSDLAAEYNARSKMVNRSIFKAGDVELPETISIN